MSLYLRECFNITELASGDEKFDSLWVRIRGYSKKLDILVLLCYILPMQDEGTRAILQAAGRSPAFTSNYFTGGLLLPGHRLEIQYSREEQYSQSGRFLQCVEDSLSTQLAIEPTEGGGGWSPLDFLFLNREGQVADVLCCAV